MHDQLMMARSSAGVSRLSVFIAEQESLRDYYFDRAQDSSLPNYGLDKLTAALSILIEPAEVNTQQETARTMVQPREIREHALRSGAPFFLGELLGLEVVNAFTPELRSSMCRIPLSDAFVGPGHITYRLPDIQADIMAIGGKGYAAVPSFHELIDDVDTQFRADEDLPPGFLKAGFGVVMYLMKEAWELRQQTA